MTWHDIGTGQLRMMSLSLPPTWTTSTRRAPSSIWAGLSTGWTSMGWRPQWTCTQVNDPPIIKRIFGRTRITKWLRQQWEERGDPVGNWRLSSRKIQHWQVGSILDFYSMISHRTLLIWEMVLTSLASWISDGLFSLSTIYGIGILNEPHICGPWYDEPLYGPACLQDFYPKAYDVVRNYFPEDVKASVVQSIRMTTHLGGGGHCRQGVFCFWQLHAWPPWWHRPWCASLPGKDKGCSVQCSTRSLWTIIEIHLQM